MFTTERPLCHWTDRQIVTRVVANLVGLPRISVAYHPIEQFLVLSETPCEGCHDCSVTHHKQSPGRWTHEAERLLLAHSTAPQAGLLSTACRTPRNTWIALAQRLRLSLSLKLSLSASLRDSLSLSLSPSLSPSLSLSLSASLSANLNLSISLSLSASLSLSLSASASLSLSPSLSPSPSASLSLGLRLRLSWIS